jgi:hypothetical protein
MVIYDEPAVALTPDGVFGIEVVPSPPGLLPLPLAADTDRVPLAPFVDVKVKTTVSPSKTDEAP